MSTDLAEDGAAIRPRALVRLARFLRSAAGGGLVLMAAAALALVLANSPAAPAYFGLLGRYVGGLSILHWVNDALMALFFLLVGLEIKREFLIGQLSTWSLRALPGIAAFGGMVAPALVYLAFNGGPEGRPGGWAIPAATDIAFALAVLALLGPRVPISLKIFLTALAVIDDLGAVLIIAAFYTSNLDGVALAGAALVAAALAGLNLAGRRTLWPYLVLGALLWFLVLKSGVHATIAGVVLAFAIPLLDPKGDATRVPSPLDRLEHALHAPVALFVVPLFGFANAGVSLAGVSPARLLDPVPLGILLGLLAGKQIGVFGAAWLAVRSGLARLPEGATWRQVYGVSLLCGIGFTMSLFIGLLAFPGAPALVDEVKIGVLAGSVASAIVGALVLATAPVQRLSR